MSAERTVVKNTAWAVLQPLLMNVLSLAATGYIARQLGVAEYGRFNLGYAFVAMFTPLTNLGLRSLTIRHVAANRDSAAEYLGRVLILRLILAFVVAAVAVAAIPLSGGSGHTRDVIFIATIGMVVTTLSGVLTDGFQAFELMRPTSLASFAGGVLLTVASVAALYFGGGIREMALAYLLGPICTLILLGVWCRKQPFLPRPRWDLSAFRQILRQASPFFLITLLEVISTRIDILILSWVLGEARLGCYTAAMSLVDRAMVLSDGAAAAILPTMSHLVATHPAAAVPLLRKSALWLLVISLPLAVVTTALSPLIVSILFGAQYLAAAPILGIAIWRIPTTCISMLQGNALFAVERQDVVLRTAAIGMATYTVFVFPLVYFLGPGGAALALTVRPMISIFLRLPAMKQYYPSFWPWRQLGRLAAAIVLMALPFALTPQRELGAQLWSAILASGVVYAASLTLLRLLPTRAIVEFVGRRVGFSPARFALVGDPEQGRD